MRVDEYFEVFSIHAVANGILTDNIDPFLAHLVGNEFGLDGVAIMVQGELCPDSDKVNELLATGKNHIAEFNLFQSKTSERLDYGDISKFFDAVTSFFDKSFLNPSDQLLDLMSASDVVYSAALKRNPTLRLFFVTTGSGEVSEQISKLVEANKTRFYDLNIFDEIEISIIGAKVLQVGYRSATNSVSARIEINKPITLPEHPSVQQAFLGFVDAEQLVGLVTVPSGDGSTRRINKAVFFDNIRDFNSKSEINQSIIKELKDGNPESFVFKNNGVTVVAREINRKGDYFELEDFQIVNGCQTSNILYLAGDHARGVSVPFRLIGSNDPEFVSTIIVGTNRQNEVKEEQFWALTPFMKDLEEYCKEQPTEIRIFIERRENQYRNETVERTRVCKPSELVKSMAAMFLFQPHRSARDYRGIRQEFSSKIFQVGHSVVPYHVAAFASYKTDFLIRNRRVPNAVGIYKYYVLSALGRQLTGGKEIFELKRSKQEEICSALIDTFINEDALVILYTKVSKILDKMIATNAINTREKVRDYIRTDATAKAFESEFLKA